MDSMEAAKVELEIAGLNVLARHMDIWTTPFVTPKEDGLGAPSFARIIPKLREPSKNVSRNSEFRTGGATYE